jgi:glycerol-1-phosphate dehydrogenase [NAD(P)+]
LEQIRQQIIPFDQMYENLKAVGAPYEPEMICVSREHLKETVDVIPFMRARISCIDILYRLGYLEEFKTTLFSKGARWEVAE